MNINEYNIKPTKPISRYNEEKVKALNDVFA